MDEAGIIRDQSAKIAGSGVLGRSRSYQRLLDYLVACSLRDHAPKELEIAVEVFSKSADFDPSQDSMVRVYAHNLRQKLKQYYAKHGQEEPHQIAIPRGEYRITVAAPETQAEPASEIVPTNRFAVLAGALVLLGVGILIG